MNTRFRIILAIILFVGFYLLIQQIFAPKGQQLTEWKVLDVGANENLIDKNFQYVTAPFSKKVDKVGIYQLSTIFYPSDEKADVISIPRINGYAFEVSLNGQFIFRRGDLEVPTANLWNHSYLVDIPKGLLHQKNILVIHVKALNDIGLIMVPTVARRQEMNFRVELQNLVTDGSSYMITGASFILGLMLLFLGFRMVKNKRQYYQFGLSFLFFCIYNFEFTFREFTGTLDVYLWIRKFLLLSIMLSIGYLFQGVITYLYQYTFSNKVQLGYVIICLPLLFATSFPMLRDMIATYNMGIILMVTVMIIQILRSKQNKLVFSVTFVLLTIFHTIIVFVFNLQAIVFLNYGIIVMLISLTYHVILDVGNLQEENLVLNRKTQSDTLTVAFNREYLDIMVYHSFDTIVFIDLDNFKKYNDTHGHSQGDVLLQDVVDIIRRGIRLEDAIIRYGGDEFVIILKHTPLVAAKEKIENFREAIRSKYDIIDISYGLSQYNDSIHETLRRADKYMYRMKEAKKTRT